MVVYEYDSAGSYNMNISAKVCKAREYLSSALQQQINNNNPPHVISDKTTSIITSTVNYEHKPLSHHSELLANRKCYYKQIKASKILSSLVSSDSIFQVSSSDAMNDDMMNDVENVREADECNNSSRDNYHSHHVVSDSHGIDDDHPAASTTTTSTVDIQTSTDPNSFEQLSNDLNHTQDADGDVAASNTTSFDKLHMKGFYAIQELLCQNKSKLNNVELRDPTNRKVTNAAYCYDNTPFEGWRKEISVRMSGKSQGTLDIHYIAKNRKRRFRSKNDIMNYLTQNNLPLIDINKFEFRSVFCVCHSIEDTSRSYLECSFGKTGCNRWVHPECVGLGVRTEQELKLLPRVTCPFCTAYLSGNQEMSGLLDQQSVM